MSLFRAKRDGKPVGSWIVEIEYAKIGQIRLATGEKRRDDAAAYQKMLRRFATDGRWDFLRQLKDGTLDIRDVMRAQEAGTLASLPSADTLQRLADVMPDWIKAGRSKHTKRNRASFGRRILAMKRDAVLADLPDLLALLKKRKVEHPRTFNEMLMHMRSLLKDGLGERSNLYQDIKHMKPLPYRAKRRQPWSVAELRERMDYLGELRGRMLWELVLTGMRPNEYWRDCDSPREPFGGDWEEHSRDGYIAVHGTKTASSERIVPLVEHLEGPSCSYAAFKLHLAKYGERSFPYLARHTFVHLLERTGIPLSRQHIYAGHQLPAVRGTYLWHECGPFVADDADAFRRVLGEYRLAVVKGRASA